MKKHRLLPSKHTCTRSDSLFRFQMESHSRFEFKSERSPVLASTSPPKTQLSAARSLRVLVFSCARRQNIHVLKKTRNDPSRAKRAFSDDGKRVHGAKSYT